ncbi:MAG: P-loop NTPase [Thermoplasmata archaeon]
MVEVVIASGKGGVGKSTISSSISALLSYKNIGIVDADAEAPNLHLIFDINSWAEEIEYKEKNVAVIDYEKCINCSICQEVCTYEAVENRNGLPNIKEYICEGCGACRVVCPVDAVRITKNNLSGWIRVGRTKYGPFVTSELDVGQPNSGKLVTEEKNIAKKWVREGKIKHIVVDSAAGIGCQVIASMSGANYALLVAEPTESSLSDLRRVFYLAEHFRTKSFIIINKENMNPGFNGIRKFSEENDLEIIGKIPYDRTVAASMTHRMPLVEYDGNSPASRSIKEIASFLEDLIL